MPQANAEGYASLHAWDHPNQMAGNGTIGLEILERLPVGKALEAGKVVQITPNSLAKTLSAIYVAVVLLLCGGNESLSNMMAYTKHVHA